MAVKQVEVEGIGTVGLYKRRGARNLRLSIAHDGRVRVTLPSWAPYKAGLDFLTQRLDWIKAQQPSNTLLHEGHGVGKAHHIHFEPTVATAVSTRLKGNQIVVLLPDGLEYSSAAAQQAAQKAAIRALKKEANQLLPSRLRTLAHQHGYTYRSVTIKQLKGRWGSCSQQQDIVLNCFLMQLPWDLIDYVILHELAHTRVMAHGPAFWAEMDRALPKVQQYRKLIKTHKPIL